MAVLASFAVAFLIAFVVTPALRASARRRGTLDVPNERSSHRVPTPRNGGIAIVSGIVAGTILLLARQSDRASAVILAGTLVTAVSAAVDERRPLPRPLRFLIQIAIAVIPPLATGLLLQRVSLPYIAVATHWLAVPVTLFWIVGVVNAYNFMDGLNGIASVEAIVCGATMALLALRRGDVAAAALAASIAGAAAGFLPWNLGGSIFMGDVGSASLGFLFALTALRLAGDGVSFVAAALPLAPFILDAGVTLIRRAVTGQPFFSEPHRSHYYQWLNQLGWPHAGVTALWGGLAAACGALALAYDGSSEALRAAVLIAVAFAHAALFAIISFQRILCGSKTTRKVSE
jgi:UDP-GlcNAc:undecaprenyl-phosphate GlcNAc-1-phosphate transferase